MGVESVLTGVPGSDQLEIIREGNHSFSIPADTTGAELLAHNLGFIPIPIVLQTDSNGAVLQPLPSILSTGSTGSAITIEAYVYAQVDEDNIYFQYINEKSTDLGTFYFKYFLLRKTAK